MYSGTEENKKSVEQGAWEIVQWQECFLCKFEDLCSNPWHPCKKPGKVCLPETSVLWEVETGGLLGFDGTILVPGSMRDPVSRE